MVGLGQGPGRPTRGPRVILGPPKDLQWPMETFLRKNLAKIAKFLARQGFFGQNFGPLSFRGQNIVRNVKKVGHPWSRA